MKKTNTSKLILGALLTSIAVTSSTGMVHAESQLQSHTEVSEKHYAEVTTKYPQKVMEDVRKSLGVNKHSTIMDAKINAMPKVEVMNRYLPSFGEKVKGKEARKAVLGVFNIDLNSISEHNYGSKLSVYDETVMKNLRESLKLSSTDSKRDKEIMAMSKNEVMDRYMKNMKNSLTSQETRTLINNIYGVNLDGISSIEHSRLGLFSKGVWVIQSDRDVFTVSSTNDDVTIYVAVTDYFKSKTGSTQVPTSLANKLKALGFSVDSSDRYFYTNPTGESLPESFKGSVMQAVVGAIMTEYIDL